MRCRHTQGNRVRAESRLSPLVSSLPVVSRSDSPPAPSQGAAGECSAREIAEVRPPFRCWAMTLGQSAAKAFHASVCCTYCLFVPPAIQFHIGLPYCWRVLAHMFAGVLVNSFSVMSCMALAKRRPPHPPPTTPQQPQGWAWAWVPPHHLRVLLDPGGVISIASEKLVRGHRAGFADGQCPCCYVLVFLLL